jgi:hypothetical protein
VFGFAEGAAALADVGGQRHFGDGFEVGFGEEAEDAFAAGEGFEDFGLDWFRARAGRWEEETHAGFGAGAGFDECDPVVRTGFVEEEDFEAAVGGGEGGAADFGIVEDEEVVRAEVFGEVVEVAVLNATIGAMVDEEAGFLAARRGMGGDQLGRELVFVIGYPRIWNFVIFHSNISRIYQSPPKGR